MSDDIFTTERHPPQDIVENTKEEFMKLSSVSVKVYGKEACVLCEKAKQKLTMLGIPFKFHLIENFTNIHDGWRHDESVELMAAYANYDTLPIISINDEFLSYPEAMKRIKDIQRSEAS